MPDSLEQEGAEREPHPSDMLTIGQVAKKLGKTTRTVRRWPIAYYKAGATRFYPWRNVAAYMKEQGELKCTSSNGKGRRSGTRNLKSEPDGFLEQLAAEQSVKLASKLGASGRKKRPSSERKPSHANPSR